MACKDCLNVIAGCCVVCCCGTIERKIVLRTAVATAVAVVVAIADVVVAADDVVVSLKEHPNLFLLYKYSEKTNSNKVGVRQ